MCELIVLGIVIVLVLMMVCSNLLGQICGCARERKRQAEDAKAAPAVAAVTAEAKKEGMEMREWEQYMPTPEGGVKVALDAPIPPPVAPKVDGECCKYKFGPDYWYLTGQTNNVAYANWHLNK